MNLVEYSELAVKTGAAEMPTLSLHKMHTISILVKAKLSVDTILDELLQDNIDVELYTVNEIAWGLIGLSGEMGEVLDFLKKDWLHNKTMDNNILLEELGDCMWYLNYTLVSGLGLEGEELLTLLLHPERTVEYKLGAVMTVLTHIMNAYGASLETILQMNIDKLLHGRYKDGFHESAYNK